MARNTVVIVDDEPDVLESTAMIVESLGYDVVRVSDPAAILETVERVKPAVLLQDLRMPGLTVAGLVASLRSHPATATVPLVFFSAHTDLSTTAARYDAWGYLAKPFTPAELGDILQKVAGPPTGLPSGSPRDRDREVKAAFHDYWNLLSALTNYVAVLQHLPDLPPTAQAAVRGLDDIVLKLEAKTDRLRALATLWAAAETPGAAALRGNAGAAPHDPEHGGAVAA